MEVLWTVHFFTLTLDLAISVSLKPNRYRLLHLHFHIALFSTLYFLSDAVLLRYSAC